MRAVRETCRPRDEVLHGELQDAIFAADFGLVVEDKGPEVYRNAEELFRNTHPTESLKRIAASVFGHLANANEAGFTLHLNTGFGGGKTHALICLWHLARNIATNIATDILPAAGRPHVVRVAGVDGEKFGTGVCVRHADGVTTHSLWGELAYQLGGQAGYTRVVDDPGMVPDVALIREMLPATDPVLLLLDEIVVYKAKLSKAHQDCLLGFVTGLMSEVVSRMRAVLVITAPGDQTAYRQHSLDLQTAIGAVGPSQTDMVRRRAVERDPIDGEGHQVVLRRLFATIDGDAAQEASREYHNAYRRIASERNDLLPDEATKDAYAQRIVEHYPFHPRFFDTVQNRLGTLPAFQKSRGTLRLFARVIRDIWSRDVDVPLISAGDVDWTKSEIQGDLLSRLDRDQFRGAVNADIVQHAGELDGGAPLGTHRRAASAVLLESLPLTPSAGLDARDATLAVARPSDTTVAVEEALDALYRVCWHLFTDGTGTRFQFRYAPNVNKLIEERMQKISDADGMARVRTTVQTYYGGSHFKLTAWPDSPRAVNDSADLKLALCASETTARTACEHEDDSDPPRPRCFVNALVALAPSDDSLKRAVEMARRVLATEDVKKEQSDNEPVQQQLRRIEPELTRNARIVAIRAFDRVFIGKAKPKSLPEAMLVPDKNALGTAQGQPNLLDFLRKERLMYSPGDALDVDLLLGLFPGGTPSVDHEGAVTAKSVHERALMSSKLRLMSGSDVVRKSVEKGVEDGKVVVRLPSGEVFDDKGVVRGPADNRRRDPYEKLTSLRLADDVLLAPKDAPCAAEWTRETEQKPPEADDDGGTIKDESVTDNGVTATGWEEAIG
ncbi:ATP-binding protein, partial [Candidatus Poribacteria bacterium]|nr:ATP-binding protein [Candidatus Poribacteria bacterium]